MKFKMRSYLKKWRSKQLKKIIIYLSSNLKIPKIVKITGPKQHTL